MTWPLVPLGEVAETALGKMLDRGKANGYPLVPYLRNVNVQWGRIDTSDLLAMELPDGQRDRFEVRAGDLLVCEGGEIGRAAIWPGSVDYVAYQKALHRVRPSAHLNMRYLQYLLEHYASTGVLTRFATGSTIAHLPQQKLREVPVPFAPIEVQRRIVDVLEDHLSRLDAADAYVATGARRALTLVKAVLLRLIPDVAEYPDHWTTSTVGQAGRVELGRQRHPDWHTGTNMRAYLRVANVFEDRIDTSDVKEMHWPGETFERFRLQPGDVLLNEGQSPELLGRPAIYRGDPPAVAFTNTLLRFTPHDGITSEFALLVFRRHMHAGRFTREARITTNIGHLSAARFKPIEFPIPTVNEQAKIVAQAKEHLDAIQGLEGDIDRAAARSAALRRSLLSAAFSGCLTHAQAQGPRPDSLADA